MCWIKSSRQSVQKLNSNLSCFKTEIALVNTYSSLKIPLYLGQIQAENCRLQLGKGDEKQGGSEDDPGSRGNDGLSSFFWPIFSSFNEFFIGNCRGQDKLPC
jgi:hypothetical protein